LSSAETEEVRRRVDQDRSGVLDSGKLFARVYGLQPRMIIVGAVHIAQFLAPMAKLAGFDVIVIDPREAFVRSSELSNISSIVAWPDEAMQRLSLDGRTAVVTLTHDPKLDDPALDAALRSPAFYIGALGSKKTHAKRLERLAAAGFSTDDQARVRGPVGLDINAVTPAEIAVSIVAQVIGTLRAGSRAR
jgi:xanthine dehydrogenase accessory factor